MSLILNIETATNVCSVALSENNKILGFKETDDPNVHSSQLTVFIERLLKEEKTDIKSLSAVAVSKGPGSYTGLRIGVSVAKGICYALDIPLISVSTLQAMAFGISAGNIIKDKNAWLCPMIDARRMEVYSAFFDQNNSIQKDVSADIIEINSYVNTLDEREVYFFGNGAEKCKDIIQHNNAFFVDDIAPSAIYMTTIAFNKFSMKEFENMAYFEPFYLKDFIATTPKKNIYK